MAETPTRNRVQRHRDKLRKQGLRPIQFWVPDTRAPGFAEEAHRQSQVVANSPHAEDDQAFVDSFQDWDL